MSEKITYLETSAAYSARVANARQWGSLCTLLQTISSCQNAISSCQYSISYKQRPISYKQCPILPKQYPISYKQRPILSRQRPNSSCLCPILSQQHSNAWRQRDIYNDQLAIWKGQDKPASHTQALENSFFNLNPIIHYGQTNA